MNVVALSGFISKNLKVITTPGGRQCIEFDLAVRRDYKSSDGKYKYDFPHVQSWNPKINNFIQSYAGAGAHVELEGEFRTETYKGKDGKNKKIIFVNLLKLRCLDRKGPYRREENASTGTDFDSMGQTVSGESDTSDLENLDW